LFASYLRPDRLRFVVPHSFHFEENRAEAISAAGHERALLDPQEVPATSQNQHIFLDVGPGPATETERDVRSTGNELVTFDKALAGFPDGIGIRFQEIEILRSPKNRYANPRIHG
jgi:hypothetical protein